MSTTDEETRQSLIDWCEKECAESTRQIELFGTGGVKARLDMPDGSTMDITDGVIRHQDEMVEMLSRLIPLLKK